jgi:DNA-binding Xre family transcriptional regulator
MIYTNTETLTNEIRKIMKTKKITVNELSKRINKSQSATSHLLSMKNISFDTLLEIAEAINCNIEINFIDKKE